MKENQIKNIYYSQLSIIITSVQNEKIKKIAAPAQQNNFAEYKFVFTRNKFK